MDQVFSAQQELQESLGYRFEEMTVAERVAYIKEYVLHMEQEVHEMLRELPYFKPWKTYNPDISAVMFRNAWDEWADVVHFFVNISLALGISAEDLTDLYFQKNKLNHKRQQNKALYKKCVGGTE